jgi:hypothetical protein
MSAPAAKSRTTAVQGVQDDASVPENQDDGATPTFLELAMGTLDEARSIVTFCERPELHPDWKVIAPLRLLQLSEEVLSARRDCEQAEKVWSRARQDKRECERKLKETERRVNGPRGPYPAGMNLAADRERFERAVEAEAKHSQEHDNATNRVREIQLAIEAPDLVAQRELAVSAWIDEHRTAFLRLNERFQREFATHETDIAGLPGQQRRNYSGWTGSSVSEVVRKIAEEVGKQVLVPTEHSQLHQLWGDWDEIRDLLRIELATLSVALNRTEPSATRSARSPVNDPAVADLSRPPVAPTVPIAFTKVELAIVLLLRDRNTPRSMRDYAKDVGVSHTTLSRSEHWQRAWKTANEWSKSNLPEGTRDADGNLEAWRDEVCENCREAAITNSVVVGSLVVRLCEECAGSHGAAPRPAPGDGLGA